MDSARALLGAATALYMAPAPSDIGNTSACLIGNEVKFQGSSYPAFPLPPSDILHPYYLVPAILSLLASLFVVITFIRFKEIRQHPSRYIRLL
jgi:hypothetical protein